MRGRTSQRGFLLIAAVIIIAVAAAMAVVIVTLTAGSSTAGTAHLTSAQALYAAESGLDQATNQFRNGTACAGLTNATPTAVGQASYTINAELFNPTGALRTTLSAVLNAGDTTMQVISTAGYAPRGGRLRINGEDILYSGITATSFTGLQRGYAATTVPASHAVGSVVNQNVCLATARGTSDSSVRTLEVGLLPGPWSAYVDGGTVNITPADTFVALATLSTSLPAGDNLVIATVTLQNTVTGGTARTTIAGSPGTTGDLRLVRNGVTARDWNEYAIRVGDTDATIDQDNRPQKSFFLIARDASQPSGNTYSVLARGSNDNTLGEAKILVINNPPAWNFVFDSANIGTAQTPIATLATGFDAGTNLVIAWVQLDNQAMGGGGERTITAGDLRLRRTTAPAVDLATNQYNIVLRRANGNPPNRGASVLLVGRDVNAPANAAYETSAEANAAGGIRAASNILAMQGVGGAYVDGGSVGLTNTLATLATTFPNLYPGRSNLVIASTQYNNTAGGAGSRDVTSNNEAIVFNAQNRATNQYAYRMCNTGVAGSATCRHFSGAGLLWRHAADTANPATDPNANPSYSVIAAESAAGINGEAKILGIHLDPVTERRETP